MNVGELKEMLEELDDEMEVRFASQPSWPFENEIRSGEVVDLSSQDDEDYCGPEGGPDPDGEVTEETESEEILYLVEGSQIGYLPGIVARSIGWK